MIRELRYIHATGVNPYENLALEEYLLDHVKEDACILYLWQNRRTVVIGKNQNCWKECKTAELERDGGFVARRLSGGGAVFHDMGNLNFTFLAHKKNYDLDRQLDVILRAVRKWGIAAEKTGRNDIEASGRKFSGNAFYSANGRSYHHGTILIRENMGDLSRYLNVSAEKIRSKGVESVKSRVVNLAELNPELTVNHMRRALVASFGEIYGMKPEEIPPDELDEAKLRALTRKFSAWAWVYGRKIPFTFETAKRFAWGDAQIQLVVRGGKITEAEIFSDAMRAEYISQFAQALKGCVYAKEPLRLAIAGITARDEETKKMAEDMLSLLTVDG